ncbi:MAG: hypothetical protein HC819_14960 [Cyclobacteriaceae bacterium]|nr:hypothetical protein [Cyclobacteriaceae bacterium]
MIRMSITEIMDHAGEMLGCGQDIKLWESVLHYIAPLRGQDLEYMGMVSNAHDLLSRVAFAMMVEVSDMLGKSHKRQFVDARCVFSVIAMRHGFSGPFLAKLLNRQYTTIYHYKKLYDHILINDPEIQSIIKSIESKLLIK